MKHIGTDMTIKALIRMTTVHAMYVVYECSICALHAVGRSSRVQQSLTHECSFHDSSRLRTL